MITLQDNGIILIDQAYISLCNTVHHVLDHEFWVWWSNLIKFSLFVEFTLSNWSSKTFGLKVQHKNHVLQKVFFIKKLFLFFGKIKVSKSISDNLRSFFELFDFALSLKVGHFGWIYKTKFVYYYYCFFLQKKHWLNLLRFYTHTHTRILIM